MSAATPILEEEISRSGASRESLGIVVIGTVYGDIHTIGKNNGRFDRIHNIFFNDLVWRIGIGQGNGM